MTLTLTYTGARPYAELTHFKLHPLKFGFARGEARTDVPEAFIKEVIIPMIDNGASMWTVSDSEPEDKSKAMLDAVEDKTPVVEEVVETVVETPPATTEQSQAMIDAIEEGPQFSESMSRAQMMSWCRSKGIPTVTKDTKATLIEKALAFNAGVDA
jgi:hypothetical protein